ncbi:MAG: hypothetical protein NVV62_15525 [Terricaulis sp.]|nr:hypothetical protein [Terricaulis sp.]
MQIALDTARLTGRPVWDVFAAMVVGAARLKSPASPQSDVMGVLKIEENGDEGAAGSCVARQIAMGDACAVAESSSAVAGA